MSTRLQLLERIRSDTLWDLIVIGGGIHGASLAELAARNGLKVLLAERQDYASGTSGRSSRMAHGGLRYLELFDFAQVFEGIRARDEWFRYAAEYVRPETFLIPVKKNAWITRIKLKLGLTLYDLLLRDRSLRHRWIPGPNQAFPGADLAGCFAYTDGLMQDSQLVIETILSAEKHDAICLNYLALNKIKKTEAGLVVSATDELTGEALVLNTRTVANCAGPWVQEIETEGFKLNLPEIRFSRGSHLVFNVPWKGPSLLMPLAEKSRYYFVWPHRARGTMVGTTEREVATAENDPQPSADEVNEILDRLAKDLPSSGLNRRSLYYAFAGIRTLPIRSSKHRTAEISRREIWCEESEVFALVGGKFTTARATAFRGLKLVAKKLKLPKPLKYHHPEFRNGAKDLELANRVEIAVTEEQAQTIADLFCRRLRLEEEPGHGLEHLEEIRHILEQHFGWDDLEAQLLKYRTRVANHTQLVQETRDSYENQS